MDALRSQINASLALPALVVDRLLADLEDSDLLVRPHPSANHIAWQLGHLLISEGKHFRGIRSDLFRPFTSDFIRFHSRENCKSDEPSQFLLKAEYFERIQLHREAISTLLENLSEEELSQPSSQEVQYLGPTVASVFTGNASHWMMHVGQWSIVRRILDKPTVF